MRFACPECSTEYQMEDAAPLQRAGGWVRCHLCHHVFQVPGFAGTLPDKGSGRLGQLLRGCARSLRSWTGRQPGIHWRLVMTVLLSLILLSALMLWMLRDRPHVHVLLSAACDNLGCSLSPLRRPEALRVVERVFLRDPGYKGLLSLRLRFTNEAIHRQPYPDIEVTLRDGAGALLSTSRHPPEQYLAAGSVTVIAPSETVEIQLHIKDPAELAAEFSIEFF